MCDWNGGPNEIANYHSEERTPMPDTPKSFEEWFNSYWDEPNAIDTWMKRAQLDAWNAALATLQSLPQELRPDGDEWKELWYRIQCEYGGEDDVPVNATTLLRLIALARQAASLASSPEVNSGDVTKAELYALVCEVAPPPLCVADEAIHQLSPLLKELIVRRRNESRSLLSEPQSEIRKAAENGK